MDWRAVPRLLVLLGLATAAYLGLRGVAGTEAREAQSAAEAPRTGDSAGVIGVRLEPAEQRELLRAARALLDGTKGVASTSPRLPRLAADGGPAGERLLALSLSRPAAPALVAFGRGPDLGTALGAAAASLAARSDAALRSSGRLKLDVLARLDPARGFDSGGRAEIELGLDGLLLPGTSPGTDLWLLPEEITSPRLLLPDGDLQSGRLRRYLEGDPRASANPQLNPGRAGLPYATARFTSLAEGEGEQAVALYRGNALAPEVSPEALLAAARAGGEYLLRHQRPDGSFGYSYEPWDDEYARSDNLLRQAGTCYSLFELHAATRDRRFLAAGEKGVAWLLGFRRGPRPEEASARGADFDSLVSPGEEAKLGGAALLMLAMLERIEVTGDHAWLPQVQSLGRFLLFQQDADGHFRSKYFYGAADPEPFESVYYPGEAILALTRLHAVDLGGPWLAAARRAADWLILVRDRGRPVAALPHDHWLLIGLNELHPRALEVHYLEHARRIGEAILGGELRQSPYPDWIGSFYDPPRSTPAATRSEGLVALHHLAARNGLDPRPYREALLRMAAFQRRCQIAPESAFYLPRPDRALGGFRRGLTDWEVRIDYVQHNLSAFLGLRDILQTCSTSSTAPPPARGDAP